MHRGKDLLNRGVAHGTLAKHKFLTGVSIELQRRQTGRFLAAVVLFLHHEIEFVQPVRPGAVACFVMTQRFE